LPFGEPERLEPDGGGVGGRGGGTAPWPASNGTVVVGVGVE
jgi:hypothetical protein